MNRMYNMSSRIYLIISFDSAPSRYAMVEKWKVQFRETISHGKIQQFHLP